MDGEGRELATLTNDGKGSTVAARIEVTKPAHAGMMTLHFVILDAIAPYDIGLSEDRRRLGLGLEEVGFEE